jgi:hypothetical protein
MSYLPKTPSRRSRSEAKTPLTNLTSGLNSLVISSPTKSSRSRKISCKSIDGADISNPFITQAPSSSASLRRQRSSSRPLSQSMSYAPRPQSRPGSPVKVSDELQKEASGGLLSKSVKSGDRFDAVRFDYVPEKKVEMRRSKSQPGRNVRVFNFIFPPRPALVIIVFKLARPHDTTRGTVRRSLHHESCR